MADEKNIIQFPKKKQSTNPPVSIIRYKKDTSQTTQKNLSSKNIQRTLGYKFGYSLAIVYFGALLVLAVKWSLS